MSPLRDLMETNRGLFRTFVVRSDEESLAMRTVMAVPKTQT
jgi:hypothetical protein